MFVVYKCDHCSFFSKDIDVCRLHEQNCYYKQDHVKNKKVSFDEIKQVLDIVLEETYRRFIIK